MSDIHKAIQDAIGSAPNQLMDRYMEASQKALLHGGAVRIEFADGAMVVEHIPAADFYDDPQPLKLKE